LEFPLCQAKRKPHDLQECGWETRDDSIPRRKMLHPKVLKNILRDTELSVEKLDELL
jgi:hypothetical protein